MTLRSRTSIISNVREAIAGGEETAKRQLIDELRRTTPEERQDLLKKAGIVPTITHDEGLAMKADLSFHGIKLDTLEGIHNIIDTYPFNRWLTQWGVRLVSEAKQRKRAKSLLPLDILAENAMFTFNRTGGGVEIHSATYVQVPNWFFGYLTPRKGTL